ncbi:hypothetical protein MKX03_012939 [Papaver bracteatum]|nr:hypothetical protein MKX03_012939 [Papaver bracteatum]
MQRCVNVIPNGSVLQNDAISKLEEDEKENQISCTVTEFRSTLQRSYAFERSDILMGEHYLPKEQFMQTTLSVMDTSE